MQVNNERISHHHVVLKTTSGLHGCTFARPSFHRSVPGLITYVVFVGLVDGCYVVLLPVLTSTLFVEQRVLAWGFLACVNSITFTLGPPVAGRTRRGRVVGEVGVLLTAFSITIFSLTFA